MNYVVGDLQGCFRGLKALLKKVNFKIQHDVLWSVGDLVARGDDSLSTLALLYDLGPNFKGVLGNHDLHLLALANGIKKPNPKDNLKALLKSKQLPTYIDWLRQFPLARMVDEHSIMSHAGIYPDWSFAKALALSKEIQAQLQQDNYTEFLAKMYTSDTLNWDQAKHCDNRHTFIVDAFTRMRYVTKSGQLNFSEKRAPQEVSSDLIPWYKMQSIKAGKQQRILFGHWASLKGNTANANIIGLDTGYVWGGKLTCLCVETNKFIRINA